jgi:hypothetical protein
MFVQKKKLTSVATLAYPIVFDPSGTFGAAFGNAVVHVSAHVVDGAGTWLPVHCHASYDAANALKVRVYDSAGGELDPADMIWATRSIEVQVIAADPCL